MIGILAYGSLITDPGWEIERRRANNLRDIPTPFPVEYARKSNTRSGAPTLARVPQDCGKPVYATILVMKKFSHKEAIRNYLYRRELHNVGDRSRVYDHEAQMIKRNAMLIETLSDFQGLDIVYYTVFGPNFAEILQPNRTTQEKARLLAQAAIDSLTAVTFSKKLDGIQYLLDNLANGIETPLSRLYEAAILERADSVPDLAKARKFFAHRKGIIA
jgi:hypothetical protein